MKLEGVEVLIPESVRSFEEVMSKITVSPAKSAGTKPTRPAESRKTTGETQRVSGRSTTSTSPIMFNHVVDGSSNTDGLDREMEKNIQGIYMPPCVSIDSHDHSLRHVTHSLTHSYKYALTHSLTHPLTHSLSH